MAPRHVAFWAIITVEIMEISKKLKIVILDFLSEKNRGDAALNIGLLRLVNKYFDDPEISIVSALGTNQVQHLADEHDHSSQLPVTILGGLKPTFYPVDQPRQHTVVMEILNAFSLLISSFSLSLAMVGMPARMIASLLPSKSRQTLLSIWEADLVIWNRRNLRSRKLHLLEIYRVANILYHPLFAIAFGKPMAFAGTSLWALNSPISRTMVRWVLQHCFFMAFREENSHMEAIRLLPHISHERIQYLPDLSFASFDNLREIVAKRKRSGTMEYPRRIGLTLVDWSSDGHDVRARYIQSMVEVIRYFVKAGAHLVVVPQVTKKWEGYRKILNEICQSLSSAETKNLESLNDEPGVYELLSIYSQFDFLIATRLHSAIFALAVQTPVVAIAYDTGAKWGILRRLGYDSHYIIPYAEITGANVIEKVADVWKHMEEILEHVGWNVSQQINDVDLNVSLMAEYYKQDFSVGK